MLVEGGRELPDLLVVAHVLQAELVLVLHVQLLHAHLQVPHLQVLGDETDEGLCYWVTGLNFAFRRKHKLLRKREVDRAVPSKCSEVLARFYVQENKKPFIATGTSILREKMSL